MRFVMQDCRFSTPFADQELERYAFRMPVALGPRFDQKKYHDFRLAQGLLPPALLQKAVIEQFVPLQKTN